MTGGGLTVGELSVLAARPSVGKTMLASQLLIHASEWGYGSLFFSQEMTRKELGLRYVVSKSKIEADHIKRKPELAKNIIDNASEFILIDDRPALNPAKIKTQIKKIRMNFPDFPLKIIVIDYMQISKPDKKTGSRERDVAEISAGFKSIAKTENVHVMVLSQFNRTADERKPKLSDLRDSGCIEQDADVVMLMSYSDVNKASGSGFAGGRRAASHEIDRSKVCIEIGKNRNGQIGEFNLTREPKLMRFHENHYHPAQFNEEFESDFA